MRIEDCVVCKSSSFADNAHDDNDISLHYFVCPRCGKYFITDFAKDTIEGAWGLDERGIAHYLSSNDDALDPKSQTALYVEVAKKAADGKGTDLPRSIISHVVRKNVGKTPTILRIEYLVNILKNNSALTPAELANNVVLFLGARLLSPGSRLQMPPPQENIYGLLGIKIGETEGD